MPQVSTYPTRSLAKSLGVDAFGNVGLAPTADRLVNVVQGGFCNNTNLPIASTKTTFKGRRRFRFAKVTSSFVRFDFLNWYIAAVTANPTVAGSNDVTVTKAYAVITDAAGNVLGQTQVTGPNGTGRQFTIPVGAVEYLCDPLFPSDFGLSSFPALGWIEYRHIFTLSGSLRAPAADQTFRPGWSQSWRGTPAAMIDDVDATGAMTDAAGNSDAINIFFPSMVLGYFPTPFTSQLQIGDSLFARQNDHTGLGDVGGGFNKRAAYAAGIPYVTLAIGGRQSGQEANSPQCKAIYGRFTDAILMLGTNDLALQNLANVPGLYTVPNLRTIWSSLRAAGIRKIVQCTIPPRIADNNHKATDQNQMTPYVTAATLAAGAPADGYGYGPGEWRDQFNATLLPAELTAGTIDAIFDFASYCQDTTTSWKWKLDNYSGALQSASAVGATSISLDTSPPLWSSLVFEPGVANVDVGGQGGPYPQAVSGSGPYTATLTAADTYSGISAGSTPGKTHASGVTVRTTVSSDGTHPTAVAHIAAAAALKPLFAGMVT